MGEELGRLEGGKTNQDILYEKLLYFQKKKEKIIIYSSHMYVLKLLGSLNIRL